MINRLHNHWLRAPTKADLETAVQDLDLIRRSGEIIKAPWWRYTIPVAIFYMLARCLGYCLRYRCFTFKDRQILVQSGPIYLHFYPVCENALFSLKKHLPGTIIGFSGRSCLNFPLGMLAFGLFYSLTSIPVWQHLWQHREWRPWFSSLIIYTLVGRWADKLFRDRERSVLVFSHDHSPFEKALIRSANKYGHITVYVQHATVSKIFPPLFSTYSLLDGMHAAEIYSDIGGCGRALITGRQYDLRNNSFPSAYRESVLICTSPLDSEADWVPLVIALHTKNVQINLRPHPADRRRVLWQKFCTNFHLKYLNPDHINLKESLADAKIVFAGASSVLLEAGLSGCQPAQVEFNINQARGLADYYGFIKYGLAQAVYPSSIADDIDRIFKNTSTSDFNPGVCYFDAALCNKENMQLTALKLILESNDFIPESVLNAVGFERKDFHNISVFDSKIEFWAPFKNNEYSANTGYYNEQISII